MKRLCYIFLFSVAISLCATSCMSTRPTAGKGCKINAGMVGYR